QYCNSQATIDADYENCFAGVTTIEVSHIVLPNNSTTAPNYCTGGTATVTFTATSDCDTKTCSKTFTVTAAPALVLNCQSDTTLAPYTTLFRSNAKFAAWVAKVTATGGCHTVLTNNATTAPNACTGGTATVTWTATSDCDNKTCSITFTVRAAPALVLNCQSDTTVAACTSQDVI